jgi:hypothetical protein
MSQGIPKIKTVPSDEPSIHTEEYVIYHTELDKFMVMEFGGNKFMWKDKASHDQMINPRGEYRVYFETLFKRDDLQYVYFVPAKLVYHEKYKPEDETWYKGTERWIEIETDHQDSIPILEVEDWTYIGIWV